MKYILHRILVQRPGSNFLGGLSRWGGDNNYFFPENGHNAYQIKGNDVFSNMVPNILLEDTSTYPGWGQKVQTCIS